MRLSSHGVILAGVTIAGMTVTPIFTSAAVSAGMYESFYLRAVSPEEPIGAWIRYTVHKRPGHPPSGSLWCTVFDAAAGPPFMHKHTTTELSSPGGGWDVRGGALVAALQLERAGTAPPQAELAV
jgi:hypothetical protein